MQPLPHYGMIYRIWHLDLAGLFEATRNQNVWVLVMVEAASKWVELVLLRTKEAANIRHAFEERVLARFAAPVEACIDGGTAVACSHSRVGRYHRLNGRPISGDPYEKHAIAAMAKRPHVMLSVDRTRGLDLEP
eukprot:jgi/Tetstr1/457555/TSEL_044124.t1